MIVGYIDALGGISLVLFVFEGLQVAHHFAEIHVRSLGLCFVLLLVALLHHRKQILVFDCHLDLRVRVILELLASVLVYHLLCAVIARQDLFNLRS